MFDLVTAGEAFDDFLFYDLAGLPAAGQEIKTRRFARAPGGGAIITAVAGARLGLRCAVVSGLSPDARRLLAEEAVAVRNLRQPDEPAAMTVALSTRHNRRFVTFDGMNARLPARIRRDVPRVRCRHVHFALHPGRCQPWLAAIAALGRRGTTSSWDFGWNPTLVDDPCFAELTRRLDYVLFNQAEAVLYSGCRTFRRAIDWWRRSPRPVVIKLGARGSRIVGAGLDVRAAAPRTAVIDTTGAGDAFNAGFLASLLRGGGLNDALRLGNRIGALSVRRAGGIAGLPRPRRGSRLRRA